MASTRLAGGSELMENIEESAIRKVVTRLIEADYKRRGEIFVGLNEHTISSPESKIVGAEIGVADGRFSEHICQVIPNLKLYCVDPWDTYSGNTRGGGKDQQHGNFELAKERLKDFDVTYLRNKSTEAVFHVEDESLDFVYIDGNHDFDYVMEDLIGWSRKVKPGGLIAGHDYYHFTNSGVIEAVDAFTLGHGIKHWFLTEEREPSFYWIKPAKEFKRKVKERQK